jgi:HTH-type transcriptional regulator / antitoxin HigA
VNPASTTASDLPKTFPALVAWHAPRPIHDAIAHANTVEVIDAMAGFELNEDQADYLETQSRLVEAYEAETLLKPRRKSGISALEFLLSENDLTGDALAGILGVDRSIAYRILKGRRNLTADHIKKLSTRFKVSADLFLA